MCTPIAALVVVALLQSGSAATGRAVTLTLAHPLHSGETAWLEVEIGPIERGAEIEIATTDGRPLGIISPYSIRSGDSAGTYTVPVPDDAISKNRVLLRPIAQSAWTCKSRADSERSKEHPAEDYAGRVRHGS